MNEKQNFRKVIVGFKNNLKSEPSHLFVSPGRVEFIGNHTDHQGGRTLSFAINRYIFAAISLRDDKQVQIFSHNYRKPINVDLNDLTKKEDELGKSAALIRGVAAYFNKSGYKYGGFDAFTFSTIPAGMGLSSSAAFEVLIATIFNELYNDKKIDELEIAKASRYSEIEYFGKPCGLLDQITVSYGELVNCDFSKEMPIKEVMSANLLDHFDFFIIYTGKSHSNLTHHYKAILDEMEMVSNEYGKKFLSEIDENQFKADFADLTLKLPHRAVNRALHYFDENNRVDELVKYLKVSNDQEILRIISESGESSNTLLENMTYDGDNRKLLQKTYYRIKRQFPKVAVRVHGGGFAGTLLVISPKTARIKINLQAFCRFMPNLRLLNILPASMKPGEVK